MNHIPSDRMQRWVEEAPFEQKQFRQGVHIVLSAVTQDPSLREIMIMKGGILMAIRYDSPRFTTDIDFSTERLKEQIDLEAFRESLEKALVLSSARLNYGLDGKIQSCQIQPSRPDASYPSILLKIGTAYRGSREHVRLMRGQSPQVVTIDVSLNERIVSSEDFQIESGAPLLIYSLSDLISEKFRSLLQQPVRNRYRRQDIFDLDQLLNRNFDMDEKRLILRSLREKSQARGIEATRRSLANPEVKERAKKNYSTLADEIEGDLPNFDTSFDRVDQFYQRLPWNE